MVEEYCVKTIVIYTDGACLGNPGPGGWAAIIQCGSSEKILQGAEKDTTNNRMELMAAIKGLEALTESCQVTLYTDSVYVQKGASEWLLQWKKNHWKTAGKKPVKNIDLWQQMDAVMLKHDVDWQWVKGHAGHPENERVDQLAKESIKELR